MSSASFDVSIKDVHSSDRFSIYPNPACSFVVVHHPRLTEETVFSVYSIDGKKISTIPGKQHADQTMIITQQLAAGSYIIKTQMSSQVIALNFIKVA